MKIKEFYKRYFTVHKCGGCREILSFSESNNGLCGNCLMRWNIAKTETCPDCAQSAVECTCMPKVLSKTGALCLRKLYFYSPTKRREPQNRLLYFLKKNRNNRMSAFIAEELEDLVRAELNVLEADGKGQCVIVCVPRSRRAKNTYGFDQSVTVCRELSRITEIPFCEAIGRKKGGKEQKKLDKGKRLKNVRHLFEVVEPSAVEGKYIILFDDIVTTGASMSACVSLLKKSGAKGIICFCVAKD